MDDRKLAAVSGVVEQLGVWIAEHPLIDQVEVYGAICYRLSMIMYAEGLKRHGDTDE